MVARRLFPSACHRHSALLLRHDGSVSAVLSVLDQAPIPEGCTGADALRNSIDLARHAEALGYERYWVAEHHGTPMLASAAPEILIAEIAATTSRIRVGSGGVMLPHYSPLKIAETFSILAGLHPGRLDLGVGRAPGTDGQTMFALQRDRRQTAPDDFPEQLLELLAYLEAGFPAGHPWARLAALPGGPERPEVWLLGSSPQSAIWAAELGLPYSFADFINPAGAEIVSLYRERFTPSPRADAPYVAVCVWVVCADTQEAADRHASSFRMTSALRNTGAGMTPVPTVERALAYLDANDVPPTDRRTIVGTPETVVAALDEVERAYGADELMIVSIVHDHEARKRSYELVAEAYAERVADLTHPASHR
jgi:luciferase family oxidoreductase group 1